VQFKKISLGVAVERSAARGEQTGSQTPQIL
jgi:hypothetical protein